MRAVIVVALQNELLQRWQQRISADLSGLDKGRVMLGSPKAHAFREMGLLRRCSDLERMDDGIELVAGLK